MEFPPTIKYKDLMVTHSDYNPDDVLERYDALYCGGKKFRDGIEKFSFLDRRQLDSLGSNARPESSKVSPEEAIKAAARFQGMTSRWEEKKKVGRYTNYVGGLLDFFIQAIFTEEPSIVATGDFWKNFTANANGLGDSLSSVARRIMLGSLKSYRSYLSLRVERPTPGAQSLGEQKAQKGLNVVWDHLRAEDINHWQEDKGKLLWVRTYRKDMMQVLPYGPPSQVRELWTYITDKQLIEYEVRYKASDPPKPDDLVKQSIPKIHGFPRLPVIPMRINCDLWAMERLEDPALALYNRETALTVLINSAAFPILTIGTGEPPETVPDMTMGALWVGMGGKAEMVGPPAAAFDPQFKDLDNKRRSLSEVFQSLGVNVLATQGQNARQSGDAKEIDKEPLTALLVTYANGMLELLTQGVDLTAEFMGDTSEPEAKGLKNFNLSTLQDKMKVLLFAQDVQGFPETARKLMLEDVALACAPGADNDEQSAIRGEAENADLEPPEIVATIPKSPMGPIQNKPAGGAP